jgi:ribosomal protein S6--L-glutamate ligase/gamma-F420-2:alpha-L-glutamate ligase
MEQNGIEIMPTRYTGAPAVKKAVGGHGGSEVYMLEKAEPFEEGYVYQKPCDTPGRDLRVWLIGGEIIASVLRVSDTDFRSNYCLGGSAEIYELSEEEKALVQRIASLVQYDYIGIDFIFNGGHIVFNEIEDTVGARMLYDKTGIDILEIYCDYIKKNIG